MQPTFVSYFSISQANFMASFASLLISSLVLRILTLLLLLISLIVLTTNSATLQISIYEFKLHFHDVYAYRYMLSTIAIGAAYSLLQIALGIYRASQGNRLMRTDRSLTVDFYADKIMSFVLASGLGAGFGATKDLEAVFQGTNVDKFFHKGYASSSMLLLAFVCTALVSVISSYILPKHV